MYIPLKKSQVASVLTFLNINNYKMNLKSFLITITFIAVVSDYLLHPFYPQFFSLRFGMNDPKVVGYYFAALCFIENKRVKLFGVLHRKKRFIGH